MDNKIIQGQCILAGGTVTYTGTFSLGISAYVDKGLYLLQVNATNTTTAPTINLNGLGAKTVFSRDGSALAVGAMLINEVDIFVYSASSGGFRLITPVTNVAALAWLLNGNTVGSLKKIGTVDNFDLPFIANNTEVVRFLVNGKINAGIGTSLTIGLTSGFNPALASNTFIGIDIASGISTGNENTALGNRASYALTSGSKNTSLGDYAGYGNQTGSENIWVGTSAGQNQTSGNNNIGIGNRAMMNQNAGINSNISIGYESSKVNQSGQGITVVGHGALIAQTAGDNNTAIGVGAMRGNISGYENTAVGALALAGAMVNPTHGNTAVGSMALTSTTGGYNTGMGEDVMFANIAGSENVAFGRLTLGANINSEKNTAIGTFALFTATAGNSNVALGYSSGYFETGSNKLFIDNQQRASEADGRLKALIYGVFDAALANQKLYFNAATINVASLPVGNSGLASGDLYVDTAANILANSDLIVARKV